MALFGQDGDARSSRAATGGSPAQLNMIGEGTVIDGTIRSEGDIRISGHITGKVFVRGKAILSQEGSIDGDLTATSADVAGQVKGTAEVEERLVLKGTARVEATLRAGRLVIEEGAVFNGDCQMGGQGVVPSEALRTVPLALRTVPLPDEEA